MVVQLGSSDVLTLVFSSLKNSTALSDMRSRMGNLSESFIGSSTSSIAGTVDTDPLSDGADVVAGVVVVVCDVVDVGDVVVGDVVAEVPEKTSV